MSYSQFRDVNSNDYNLMIDLGNITVWHCAKWLIDYCTKNNYLVPIYYCHTLNPGVVANILEILNKATK